MCLQQESEDEDVNASVNGSARDVQEDAESVIEEPPVKAKRVTKRGSNKQDDGEVPQVKPKGKAKSRAAKIMSADGHVPSLMLIYLS